MLTAAGLLWLLGGELSSGRNSRPEDWLGRCRRGLRMEVPVSYCTVTFASGPPLTWNPTVPPWPAPPTDLYHFSVALICFFTIFLYWFFVLQKAPVMKAYISVYSFLLYHVLYIVWHMTGDQSMLTALEWWMNENEWMNEWLKLGEEAPSTVSWSLPTGHMEMSKRSSRAGEIR